MFNSDSIPQRFRDSILLYVEHRCPPGDFLEAVLANDLMEAIGRVDEEAYAHLGDICSFVYNRIPRGVWGSRENIKVHFEGRTPDLARDKDGQWYTVAKESDAKA